MKAVELIRSSAFRLSLVYMMLFAGSVLLLLGFLYWATVGYMARQTDATIEAEITGLAEQYREGGLSNLVAILQDRIERDPDSSSVYLLASRTLSPLAGNIDAWPDVETGSDGWLTFAFRDTRAGGRVFQARAQPFLLQGGLHLLVGRDTRELKATQRLIIRALVWGTVLTLALAMIGSIIMSRSMLKRIERINQASREIMAGDLQRRIETTGSNDEFDQLAISLNAMLDEIEQLMSGIRHVTDNVAHDLRTPLTRLRNRLEQLHTTLDTNSKNAVYVEQSIADADQLLATFGALLRIARIEAGGVKTTIETVDLAQLLQDAAELYDAVAEEKQIVIDITLDAKPQVQGDRDLLFQAIINLLDNAIKYSPAGGRIQMRLVERDNHPLMSIADNGPGIPVAERENVLQRFYRMDQSRSQHGSGLGLSLVAAVARMHNATIEFGDNHPGLIAELHFRSPG
ncbi:MAG: HAMP domain-containing histidine kinase [Gammaproteobacteria bacterium]|nr:HAMP domain-containing histidine kinase [Gammaproteobacteria bacterium]NNJ98225.1 HAMP domain-containing histidine kinase [Gammaproteobacteria bacterium]